MQNAKEDWRTVRRQRARPPVLAGEHDDRRDVFQAALTQAEELWDAAAVAGPATRPLPLFYCVSQAGRAVCAAWTALDAWEPKGHGLRSHEADDPDPMVRVLGYETSLRGGPRGSYSMVATATESTTFAGRASVAELWASLSGFPTPTDIFGDRPQVLNVEAVAPTGTTSIFGGGPATHCRFRGRAPEKVEQLPDDYPTTRGIEQDGTRRNVLGWDDPIYRFAEEDGSLRPVHEVGVRPFYSEGLFEYAIRPKVGSDPIGPPSEFLTLWALLFCLSELARYHPDTWVGALDPDRSIAAVTLEHGLDLALQRAPSLIAGALSGPIPARLHEDLRRLMGGPPAATDPEGEPPADEPAES